MSVSQSIRMKRPAHPGGSVKGGIIEPLGRTITAAARALGVAYIWLRDLSVGWLLVNIWHNFQYIVFVWMFNNRRFRAGIDPRASFLSYISQNGKSWLYLATCIAITGGVYWGVLRTLDWLFFAGLSATIVLYQIVNFHHYVVDALIWKRSKARAPRTLAPAG